MSDHFRIFSHGDRRVIALMLPTHIESLDFDVLHTRLAEEILRWPGGHWCVDLEAAEYYGSALLGLLVNLRTHVKKMHGELSLCGIQAPLQRVIDLGNLHRLFVIAAERPWAGL